MKTVFDAIGRDPDSDAVRAVAADLMAEDDPDRSVFIQLQLAQALSMAQRKEMARLRRTHHRRWLGPTADVLAPGHYSFNRGFVSIAHVSLKSRRQARTIAAAPHWSTIEQLSGGKHLPTLLRHAVMPALHTMGTAFLPGPDDTRRCPAWGQALRADTLAGIRVPALHGLQVDLSSNTLIQAFRNCFGRGNLAGLREVGIRCRAPVFKVVLEEFPDTLERISLDVPQREIQTWLKLVVRLFPRLETVDVVLNANVVPLRRAEDWRGLEHYGPIHPTWP